MIKTPAIIVIVVVIQPTTPWLVLPEPRHKSGESDQSALYHWQSVGRSLPLHKIRDVVVHCSRTGATCRMHVTVLYNTMYLLDKGLS
jgi:hypothetical protein